MCETDDRTVGMDADVIGDESGDHANSKHCDLKAWSVEEVYFDGLVGPSAWHRSLDGNGMSNIRQELGVTQAVFAAQCGHSQQFQVQIERPGSHEIPIEKAKDIITAVSFYK